MSNSPYRGSVWRKWDLHTHSPKSFLANQYGSHSIDDYIQKIINVEIKAIGLTNYFRFADGELEEIKKKLNAKGIAVFPNLEFRTQPPNKEKEEMHIHLIFSDQTPINKINNFLGRLRTVDDKYCKDLTQQDIEKTSIAFQTLQEALIADKEIKHLKDYLVVACPRGDGNFRPSAKDDGRGNNFAVVIDKCTDILFGKDSDTQFFSKTDRYEKAVPKPVFFCSDSHKLNDIGSAFSWVKADLTFEGLKQVIYEPMDRIKIQELKPEEKSTHAVIDRVEYKDKNGNTKSVYFNQNLNSIIGSRAKGKSNLLKNIAYAIDPKQCELRDINSQDFLPLSSFKLFWADNKAATLNATDVKDKGVLFIPQKYLGELVYEESSRFDQFLVNLFENREDFQKGLENYHKFEDSNVVVISSLIRRLITTRATALEKLEKVKKLGKKEDQDKEIKEIEEKIQKSGKMSSITSAELKSHDEISSEKSKVEKELAFIEQDIVCFNQLKDEEFVISEDLFERNFSKKSLEKIQKELAANDKAFKNDFIVNEIKELTQTKVNVTKKLTELEKLIKPLQEKIKQSKALLELTDLLKKKKEARVQTEVLMKEFNELKSLYENDRKGIIDAYSRYEDEFKGLTINFGELKFSQVKLTISFDRSAFCKTVEDYINFHNSTIFKKDENNKYKNAVSFLNNPTEWNYDKRNHLVLIKELLDGVLSGQLLLKSGRDTGSVLAELFKNRYKIDFLESVKSLKGVKFSDMSDGEQMLALLEFIFKFDNYNYPVILDQPEDDLDSKAISTTIVDFVKSEKVKRQIIIASHNANLVICGDSENIIISEKKGGKTPEFEYTWGSIEEPSVSQEIVTILEGGENALRKRMHKLNIQH
jgi:hypothetical protein